jgi:hypothetical protein
MNRVRALVELVLRYDPYGPERLVGEMPEPDWAELIDSIREHVDIGRLDGGVIPIPEALADILTKETVEDILSEVGGWDTVVEASASIRERCPKRWSYLKCHGQSLTLYQMKAAFDVKMLLFEAIFAKTLDKKGKNDIIKIGLRSV